MMDVALRFYWICLAILGLFLIIFWESEPAQMVVQQLSLGSSQYLVCSEAGKDRCLPLENFASVLQLAAGFFIALPALEGIALGRVSAGGLEDKLVKYAVRNRARLTDPQVTKVLEVGRKAGLGQNCLEQERLGQLRGTLLYAGLVNFAFLCIAAFFPSSRIPAITWIVYIFSFLFMPFMTYLGLYLAGQRRAWEKATVAMRDHLGTS